MRRVGPVDEIVRSALQISVQAEEPAAQVRDLLLANAAQDLSRSALGPSIPALASGLQENEDQTFDWGGPTVTAIPIARRQLLLLAAPLYAVR